MDVYKRALKDWRSKSRRGHGLSIATALVLAFTRHFVETDRFIWDSLSSFIVSWIIHYFGLWLFFVLPSYIVINRYGRFFLGDHAKEFSVDEASTYVPLVILTCSLAIVVIHLFGMASSGLDIYEP